MTSGRPCAATRADGSPCRAQALPGKSFCTFHDPATAARRRAGRRAGGRARLRKAVVLPPDTPDAPLATTADVAGFLALTVNQTRRGELDAKVANCLGLLCGTLLRALESSELVKDLEARLAALEAADAARRGRRALP
jgi:hypothetical protein